MDKKTFILAALLILVVIPVAMAAYATFKHGAFIIGDGKDIDLNGQTIGNGTISGLITGTSQLDGGTIVNVTMTNATCNACNSTTNASLITTGTIPNERYGTGILTANISDAYTARVKVGSFTKNTADASAVVTISGVGFQPTHVTFNAAVGSRANETSFGFDDNVSHMSTYNSGNTPGGFVWATHTSQSIDLVQSVSDMYQGYISAFNSDGFNITFTKTGSTTGTATIVYKAEK
jgi:hypothetical protein